MVASLARDTGYYDRDGCYAKDEPARMAASAWGG